MLKNYFKVAWRNIVRQKGYSFINLFGLAIGLACCLMILLYVRNERSFDQYHEHKARIFRVEPQFLEPDGSVRIGFASLASGIVPLLQKEFPEIEHIAQLLQPVEFGDMQVSSGERRFIENRFFLSESDMFNILSLPLLKGDPKTALQNPNDLVISASMAKKYFGAEDPVGKLLKITHPVFGVALLRVAGVMRDSPANTHVHFDFIGSLLLLKSKPDWAEYLFGTKNLTDNVTYAYLRLAAAADPAAVSARFAAFIDRVIPPRPDDSGRLVKVSKFFRLILRPVTDIHLNAHNPNELEVNGDRTYVAFFLVIAFFILFLACINYTNLATARASKRAREVGLRKVVGGNRGMLAVQFLSESLLITFIALLLSLVLVWLFLPFFSNLFGSKLGFFTILKPPFLLMLAWILAITALCAGLYPALYISSFKPATILKGELTRGSGGARLRKALVVFQFAISVLLIISVGISLRQIRFFRHADLGLDRKNILLLPMDEAILKNWQDTKAGLLKSPYVKAVTISKRAPSERLQDAPGFSIEVKGQKIQSTFFMPHNRIDFDFFETYGIPIVAGRDFSRDHPTDANAAFIINETAVRQLGWESPEEAVGKPMNAGDRPGQIIGVVADFNYESLHNKIPAILTYIAPDMANTISIRMRPGNHRNAIRDVRQVWERYNPGSPFRFDFLDERLNALYRNEQHMMDMLGTFSVLAVIIASLGLFGLASFAAAKRTKEIGVRKVFGAPTTKIVAILASEFVWLVGFANLIAWPLAYLAMKRWLQGFAYRVPVDWAVFAAAGLLTLVIAMVTVSWQSIRAAQANPVDSLRYE
jgi:putative ABC transport system permease protein